MTRKRARNSAVHILDQRIGEVLSWVTGTPPVGGDPGQARRSRTDAALGDLLSWAGLGGHRRGRGRR